MATRVNNVKVWPHLTVVALVFAALGVGAAALWMRHEPGAQALALPHAARVERVDGAVGLNRGLDADAQWVEVAPNTPLTVGDRLYAREDSRAGLAFTGRNFARLEPNSSLDVVSLTDRRTQLALRDGSAIFNIGELAPGELFEVATPYGAVDFQQPGLYQVGYNDDGSAFVSVLSGLAQVVGMAGSGQIGKGEMLTLLGQTAAQIALSRLSPDYAGGLLDDYYGYQYPDLYDGRYGDYNAYLNDPYYYDPYNRHASYRYVPASIPGAYDLDQYGDWMNLNGYGYAWSPRVEDGWAPYQQGQWMMDDPYGLTWVSREPWGYAPYHYGRWLNVNNQWFWIPESADARPAYSPALVTFVPLTESNQIAWVPLAPGEQYAPAYYDANWQPHYLGGGQVLPERFLNMNAPGGVTVVSASDFQGFIDREAFDRVDPAMFERARPVRDPLSVAMLRQAALDTAVARRGFVLPPGLAKRLDDTRVFASARPHAQSFGDGRAKRSGIEAVPEKQKKQKLQFKDERQSLVVREPGRGRGDGAERRATRQLRRQEKAREALADRQELGQRQGPPARGAAERESRRTEQSARGERVGLTRQAQREAERQQAMSARQQQRAVLQQQNVVRRQARQQAEQQRAQQVAAQRAQQQQERARPQRQEKPRGHVEHRQSRPQPTAQMPQGHAHKQQAPAQHKRERTPGPPTQAGNPHGKGHGGKGKGRP